jgi:hypothetical protein
MIVFVEQRVAAVLADRVMFALVVAAVLIRYSYAAIFLSS